MTKLTGRNNTWEPHMSQWQKDNASAPFEVADSRVVRDAIVCAALFALAAFVGIFVL